MPGQNPAAREEQKLLMTSLILVLAMAVGSVIFGIWSKSSAITFDGFYSLADAGMTLTAWHVARLIARGEDRRFQYGYWHLEPLLGFVSGSLLAITCAYAFINGVQGWRTGGGEMKFGAGFVFSGVSGLLCLAMYAYIRAPAHKMESEFLKIDARGWLMGGALSLALCVSFGIAFALSFTRFAAVNRYVDSGVLMVVALCLMPFPLVTIWRAARGILQIAPTDLDAQVKKIAGEVAARHGFSDFNYHVAKVGRQRFIEIGLVAPSDDFAMEFGTLDRIRAEIAGAMGVKGPGCWLTVDFTADKRWI